jgi:hypothetical protein
MTLSSPSLRRFVRRALVDASGAPTPERAQLAAAFDVLCDRLRRQLVPLFGAVAVNALFLRAVHVAAAEFPWVGALTLKDHPPCAAERMGSVDHLETDALEEGLAAVLAHNIALLNAFIGEDFVMPVVQHAWGVNDTSRDRGSQ